MTRWARLTWQAADPAMLAADLGWRLGATPGPHPVLDGAFVLALGPAELELVPWRREAVDDHPTTAGRLVFEPIDGGAPDLVPPGPPPSLSLAGVAWSTVDLDRAEAELGVWLDGARPDHAADGTEPHLGGRTRVRVASGLPGRSLVLAEPSTEGRLAASLARDGEGPCALYLAPAAGLDAWLDAAASRRVGVSRIGAGPFGRSVLVARRPAAGPHVIVTEAPMPLSVRPSAGTIGA